jgi:hypothetical protein
VFLVLLGLSGCTFNDGAVRFEAQNLQVSGDLGDGAFVSSDGTVQLVTIGQDLARGVFVDLIATQSGRELSASLRIDGNLGALCPGSTVDMAGTGRTLSTVDTFGPPEMVEDLQALTAEMELHQDPGTRVTASRLRLGSSELGDDSMLTHLVVTSGVDVDGVPHEVTTEFDIAVYVDNVQQDSWD